MIHATPANPLPVVVGTCGLVIHVVSHPHWTVIEGADDDPEILFGIVAHGQPAELVAAFSARVAELLERHGLADTPDTAEAIDA